jgi:hypothetical protein
VSTTLTVSADMLDLAVEVIPGLPAATLKLSGPAEVVDALSSTGSAGRWDLCLPRPDSGTGSSVTINGVTFNNSGTSTVISVGTISGVSVSGGTVIVNGAVVTGGANAVVGEPITATVRLPQGSSLRTRLGNGSVRTVGHLEAVDHEGNNASLTVASAGDVSSNGHNGTVKVNRATGAVDIETHNGSIYVGSTGTSTHARAHNGRVDIHASSAGPITARTHNGAVNVHKNGHPCQVRTRTHNGSECIQD